LFPDSSGRHDNNHAIPALNPATSELKNHHKEEGQKKGTLRVIVENQGDASIP
jgi:hypothetical protein